MKPEDQKKHHKKVSKDQTEKKLDELNEKLTRQNKAIKRFLEKIETESKNKSQ